MKKVVGVIFALVAMFVVANPVHADSAVTQDEQRILTELAEGVTIGGKTFNIATTDQVQAENYLKQHDVSSEQVNIVVSNIQAARTLAAAQNVDVTNINSLTDLIKAFPTDVVAQLKDYVLAVANTLGLKVTFAPGQVTVVDPSASTSAVGGSNVVYTSGDTIKQTGATNVASFVAFGALLVAAAGAFVVSKKQTRLA
ncbi:MAG: LPXTG cell wall anchor domain-containing protein [Enterococcus sp.]